MTKPAHPREANDQRDNSTRKKRTRRPSLRGVVAQARRAGVVIGSIKVAPDGSITIVPGVEKSTHGTASAGQEGQDTASDDWDVL